MAYDLEGSYANRDDDEKIIESQVGKWRPEGQKVYNLEGSYARKDTKNMPDLAWIRPKGLYSCKTGVEDSGRD